MKNENLNFENLNLTSLSLNEEMFIEGGINLNKALKIADKILRYVGFYDAANDAYNGFIDGFNSK